MSLLRLLNEAQDGRGLATLAKRFGIEETEAGELAGMLAPTIASATRKRAEAGGLDAVAGQLMGEREAGFFDDAARAAEPEGQAQGQRFLENILGSPQATQDLAAEAAGRSGVSPGIVEQFLPAIAAMLQGGMQRQMPDNTLQGMMDAIAGGGSGADKGAIGGGIGGGLMGAVMGMLTGGGKDQAEGQDVGLGPLLSMLDQDGDGSVLDDVLDGLMRR
ncbi:hypothetical protein LNKW23_29930 [Paralimibaculum aggregatum]|uniref:DUF937 domain-containing protein n=1 Tax=Paralimibaculum aggregatum TaxID=3036245 RepID=A0ABQ6LKL5_9RHOB|nr:DUF937 domain-containing protein [Limibaculum sp. NKW23]GMG83779.1 hypothetical protein LNKW23_29930 [Limibaculum sp. NKW23]